MNAVAEGDPFPGSLKPHKSPLAAVTSQRAFLLMGQHLQRSAASLSSALGQAGVIGYNWNLYGTVPTDSTSFAGVVSAANWNDSYTISTTANPFHRGPGHRPRRRTPQIIRRRRNLVGQQRHPDQRPWRRHALP